MSLEVCLVCVGTVDDSLEVDARGASLFLWAGLWTGLWPKSLDC